MADVYPGIIFVRARIRPEAKDILDHKTLSRWYDDVHIPDMLRLPKVDLAVRYLAGPESASTSSTTQEADNEKNGDARWPYLAIYSVSDEAWLHRDDCELKKVPLTSDILPNESRSVLELVEFDTRFYRRTESRGQSREPAKAMLATFSVGSVSRTRPNRFACFTFTGAPAFGPPDPERNRRLGIEDYLALYEYDSDDAKMADGSDSNSNCKVYNLVKASGNLESESFL